MLQLPRLSGWAQCQRESCWDFRWEEQRQEERREEEVLVGLEPRGWREAGAKASGTEASGDLRSTWAQILQEPALLLLHLRKLFLIADLQNEKRQHWFFKNHNTE